MPESGEYKSTIGVDQLYYALITQDDDDGYAAGTPAKPGPGRKCIRRTQHFA